MEKIGLILGIVIAVCAVCIFVYNNIQRKKSINAPKLSSWEYIKKYFVKK